MRWKYLLQCMSSNHPEMKYPIGLTWSVFYEVHESLKRLLTQNLIISMFHSDHMTTWHDDEALNQKSDEPFFSMHLFVYITKTNVTKKLMNIRPNKCQSSFHMAKSPLVFSYVSNNDWDNWWYPVPLTILFQN